jgi:hypothetical protein
LLNRTSCGRRVRKTIKGAAVMPGPTPATMTTGFIVFACVVSVTGEV